MDIIELFFTPTTLLSKITHRGVCPKCNERVIEIFGHQFHSKIDCIDNRKRQKKINRMFSRTHGTTLEKNSKEFSEELANVFFDNPLPNTELLKFWLGFSQIIGGIWYIGFNIIIWIVILSFIFKAFLKVF